MLTLLFCRLEDMFPAKQVYQFSAQYKWNLNDNRYGVAYCPCSRIQRSSHLSQIQDCKLGRQSIPCYLVLHQFHVLLYYQFHVLLYNQFHVLLYNQFHVLYNQLIMLLLNQLHVLLYIPLHLLLHTNN